MITRRSSKSGTSPSKMHNSPAPLLIAALLLLAVHQPALTGPVKNGFDLTGSLVPADEILAGGPPRDGIPSIDRPRYTSAAEATFLQDDDRVLGISRNGNSRAYPVAILNWHEIVNDRLGAEAITVTWCPLCGTGIAYRAGQDGEELEFGVSGLLYNSDMLLYDRSTHSLWSQITRQAISGPLQGRRLEPVALEHTRWADWRRRHPRTEVLSIETGYRRDYRSNPYHGYEQSRRLWFQVAQQDMRYHPKERVLGVEIDGQYRAYPFVELAQTDGRVEETFSGSRLIVTYDRDNQSARATLENGVLLPAVTAYWFAWYAFHPDTTVYRAAGKSGMR